MKKYEKTQINLMAYQKDALETAFYPRIGSNISYPIIAVFEECGELTEKLHEIAPNKEIAKELGDVLWYCAMVFHELGRDFKFELEKCYMTPMMLHHKTCRVAGLIKKSERDNNGVLSQEKKEELLEYFNFILSFVYNIGLQIDFTLAEICDMNIKKIASRIERGQLAGSGDNR